MPARFERVNKPPTLPFKSLRSCSISILVDATNRNSETPLRTPAGKATAAASSQRKTPTSTSFHSRSQVPLTLLLAPRRWCFHILINMFSSFRKRSVIPAASCDHIYTAKGHVFIAGWSGSEDLKCSHGLHHGGRQHLRGTQCACMLVLNILLHLCGCNVIETTEKHC